MGNEGLGTKLESFECNFIFDLFKPHIFQQFEMNEQKRKAIEELEAVQSELDALDQKANEEIFHVEQKYRKLRKPIFEKRTELIKRIPHFWSAIVRIFW